MDKIFRQTKVTKFSDGEENFVRRKFCPIGYNKLMYKRNTKEETSKCW